MPLQTCTRMTRVIASFGSPKNADEVPNAAHTRAAGPADGLKISEKIRPITVTPRIVGRKTTARARLRPQSRWLSSTAISRAIRFWKIVTAIANTNVLRRAYRLYASWAEEKNVW